MPNVISIKDLSKQYSIYHENGYATLVETLSQKAKQILHPFRNHKLTKTHETFWALQDINLDIEEGDRVGIIGRNGAGKSTLLKILSRITEPTSGTISVRGRVSSLLEVGTGFHPELTGRENIYLNGAILGMKRAEIKAKFDEIVAFAEIERFLDTPVKRFSSGMYARLGFAIAAHLDSDLLIVDEVLAVGDTQFQERCLKKLGNLSQVGRTVLFVSHDIGSILTLCNKGVYLDKGRIIEQGPIDSCVNAYMKKNSLKGMLWEGNEGDEHVRFYRASFSESPARDFFYQDEVVQIEIEYEVLTSLQDLVLGVGIWNQRNQPLARSRTCDNHEKYQKITQPGRKRALFTFDACIFHEGDYSIKLDCFIHNKKRIIQDEIDLKFPVFNRKKNTRFSHAADYTGIFLGNKWTIQEI